MPAPSESSRVFYLDNLKWLMIVLVIFLHAGVTYSGSGSWYYVENAHPDLLTWLTLAPFLSFTQAYFMGFLFFIAGVFVPASLERRGTKGFLGERLFRLGLPLLFYIVIISPFIDYCLTGLLAGNPRPPFGEYLARGFLSRSFLGGTGPLWFAETLLLFSACYALLRPIVRRWPVPQSLSPRLLVVAVCVISAVAFAIRIFLPIGSSVANLQFCFFPGYVALFVAGTWAGRADWLSKLPRRYGPVCLIVAVAGGLAIFGSVMLLGGALTDGIGPYMGGLHWQAAAYAFWESFFCVFFCAGLLAFGKYRLNGNGGLSRFMARSSFGVYVFHAPILIAITLLMRPIGFHPLVKFLLAGSATVVVSFLFSGFVLARIPGIRRIFR
jgi:surface polysaccharide O-acyltransferase-like enzyme